VVELVALTKQEERRRHCSLSMELRRNTYISKVAVKNEGYFLSKDISSL
jgi:hypothetical protein